MRTALDSYSFCVGSTAFGFSSAGHTDGNKSASWSTTAVSGWSAGDTPSLSIGTSCAQTRSTNANLSGLTVGSSTSSTGTFTDFNIGTFFQTVTTYTRVGGERPDAREADADGGGHRQGDGGGAQGDVGRFHAGDRHVGEFGDLRSTWARTRSWCG